MGGHPAAGEPSGEPQAGRQRPPSEAEPSGAADRSGPTRSSRAFGRGAKGRDRRQLPRTFGSATARRAGIREGPSGASRCRRSHSRAAFGPPSRPTPAVDDAVPSGRASGRVDAVERVGLRVGERGGPGSTARLRVGRDTMTRIARCARHDRSTARVACDSGPGIGLRRGSRELRFARSESGGGFCGRRARRGSPREAKWPSTCRRAIRVDLGARRATDGETSG